MLAYRNLKDIVDKVIVWETERRGLYQVAAVALRNPESRKLVELLEADLAERLRILCELDLRKFGGLEWMKIAALPSDDEMVPRKSISRDSSPEDIVRVIIDAGERLMRFYEQTERSLVSRSQKELFKSLALFTSEQIRSIRERIAPGA